MHNLANSEDPDEMRHNAAFHQGQHRLLRQEGSKEKAIQCHLEIITCVPSIYTMDHPKYIIKPVGRIHLCIKG